MSDATHRALLSLLLIAHQAIGTAIRLMQGEQEGTAEDVERPGKYPVPTFGGKPPQDQPTEQG